MFTPTVQHYRAETIEQLVERNARLAQALRKATAVAHQVGKGHTLSVPFSRCSHPECRKVHGLLDLVGVDAERTG